MSKGRASVRVLSSSLPGRVPRPAPDYVFSASAAVQDNPEEIELWISELSTLAEEGLPKTGSVITIIPVMGNVKQIDSIFFRFGKLVENVQRKFV